MEKLTKDDIDKIAIKYLELQDKSISGKKDDIIIFEEYQNFCAQKLKNLILHHTKKYRRFSNYKDLEQDGFEALLNALGTYNPEKGSFAWWANRYIKTRIQRKANAHSTIKFPIRMARETKPYKTSEMPVRIDPSPTPLEEIERVENYKKIKRAMESLDEKQKIIINMKYGFNGTRERPIGKILEELCISRQQYAKLLSEAENQIRKHLSKTE